MDLGLFVRGLKEQKENDGVFSGVQCKVCLYSDINLGDSKNSPTC